MNAKRSKNIMRNRIVIYSMLLCLLGGIHSVFIYLGINGVYFKFWHVDVEHKLGNILGAERKGQFDIALAELNSFKDKKGAWDKYGGYYDIEYRLHMKNNNYSAAAISAAQWREWLQEKVSRHNIAFPFPNRQVALAWGLEAAARRETKDYRAAMDCIAQGVSVLQHVYAEKSYSEERIDYALIVLLAESYILATNVDVQEIVSAQQWMEIKQVEHPYIMATQAYMKSQLDGYDVSIIAWTESQARRLNQIYNAFGLMVPSTMSY